MRVHFLHVGKTGGTAIKAAIREARRAGELELDIRTHRHKFTLAKLPPKRRHRVFFVVRDPVSRFASGFYSRQRMGQPRYYRPWSDAEAKAFGRFHTPRELATALADGERAATAAMKAIVQLRPLKKWLESPDALEARRRQILYVARQETLDTDWPALRELLRLPSGLELPSDPRQAHRPPTQEDRTLDDAGREAILHWYRDDYPILEWCMAFRETQPGAA